MHYNHKKISKQEKEELNDYVASITGNTILAVLAHDCISMEEVNALQSIVESPIMRNYKNDYALHRDNAPRNRERILEKMEDECSLTSSEEEKRNIWEKFKAENPWYSKVKEIKTDAMHHAESLLLKANIGKKRRKKIMSDIRRDFVEAEYEQEQIAENFEVFMKKMNIL